MGCKLHNRSIGGDKTRDAAAPTCVKGLRLTTVDDDEVEDEDDETPRSSSVSTDAPIHDEAESTYAILPFSMLELIVPHVAQSRRVAADFADETTESDVDVEEVVEELDEAED